MIMQFITLETMSMHFEKHDQHKYAVGAEPPKMNKNFNKGALSPEPPRNHPCLQVTFNIACLI